MAFEFAGSLSRLLKFDAPAATAVLFQAGVVLPSDKDEEEAAGELCH
jgi:hypothetical protein